MTLDPDLLAWVEERTGGGRDFYSLSDALDKGLRCLMERHERQANMK